MIFKKRKASFNRKAFFEKIFNRLKNREFRNAFFVTQGNILRFFCKLLIFVHHVIFFNRKGTPFANHNNDKCLFFGAYLFFRISKLNKDNERLFCGRNNLNEKYFFDLNGEVKSLNGIKRILNGNSSGCVFGFVKKGLFYLFLGFSFVVILV